MTEFWQAVTSFPAVLLTAALVVVVVFWVLVLAGVAEADGFDADVDAAALRLGGVPVAVAVSLLVALAWFLGVAGAVLLARTGWSGVVLHLLGVGVLLASVAVSWRVTGALVRSLAKLLPDEPAPSRHDFVGQTCTIRTGRVDAVFGQAEVAARDGSTAVVQVRQNDGARLALGSTGLLYAYDDDGGFFWVAPFDAALDPRG
ncbi:hypothetical protein [Streptomyces thermolilacinus]|uniref:DUF1449 domain-containing protein n=1 Tax=Streptomyces thermolilacinus SPC6 TaxID=1306406 RepID=A0A1D3DST7_9ACTN|nr:hypothetical protein [Streptomyces thermolilacinus]OEJ95389.1 hypothetical protein J116_013810 [Streptomyces thermolilacinus SPC6]